MPTYREGITMRRTSGSSILMAGGCPGAVGLRDSMYVVALLPQQVKQPICARKVPRADDD